MQVLITGASGMIGSAVASRFIAAGHRVLSVTRARPVAANQIQWDPLSETSLRLPASPLDAVIHLAGDSIGTGRWNEAKKARILNSRVKGARLLVESLAGLETRPRALVGASAVGYYGNRGDEVLREESSPGAGFLAEVCQKHEAELRRAAELGIRTVILRFGMVLCGKSGALPMMVRPFRLGLGGRLGSGEQYMSWITLEDALNVIERSLTEEGFEGPVIATSPNPVRNRDFATTLGKVLGRPALVPTPAFALRIALGEMADAVVLAGQRAEPARLQSAHFAFRFPELERALRTVLGG